MATPAELVRAHFHARASRDVGGAMALFDPDVVLHMPDVIPFAARPGIDRMAAVLDFALHMTDGTYAAELVDVVEGGTIAVAIVAATATRDGVPFSHHQAWTYRFDGDVVVEAWVHLDRPDTEIARFYGGTSA